MSLFWHRSRHFSRSLHDLDSFGRDWYLDLEHMRLNIHNRLCEIERKIQNHLNGFYREESFRPTIKLKTTAPKLCDHQITVNCKGYMQDSIKVKISNDFKKIIVTGQQTANDNESDFELKEFKKTFDIPLNADVDKFSYTFNLEGVLIINIPLKFEESIIIERNEVIPITAYDDVKMKYEKISESFEKRYFEPKYSFFPDHHAQFYSNNNERLQPINNRIYNEFNIIKDDPANGLNNRVRFSDLAD